MKETKLSKLTAAAKSGDWETAICIASKFGELGAEKTAIMQAREAYTRPDFQKQIGKDPEQLKAAGIAALRGRYNV
jgi:hypothetical protein